MKDCEWTSFYDVEHGADEVSDWRLSPGKKTDDDDEDEIDDDEDFDDDEFDDEDLDEDDEDWDDDDE